jgi:hypothetical protein
MLRPHHFLICALVFAVLAGCEKSGPELAPVRGRVTLDGRPLATADVMFQPEGGERPSIGRTAADGRYELGYKRGVPGAIVGPHKVAIALVTEITRGPQIVPPRYNTESELRVEVEPVKQNVFDFDLTSDAK